MRWIIVNSDGDIDYTNVFGPFASEEEAEEVLPQDTEDSRWRVMEILPASAISDYDENEYAEDEG